MQRNTRSKPIQYCPSRQRSGRIYDGRFVLDQRGVKRSQAVKGIYRGVAILRKRFDDLRRSHPVHKYVCLVVRFKDKSRPPSGSFPGSWCWWAISPMRQLNLKPLENHDTTATTFFSFTENPTTSSKLVRFLLRPASHLPPRDPILLGDRWPPWKSTRRGAVYRGWLI